mgnify:FL=1
MSNVIRSQTGKYHLGLGSATNCNGRKQIGVRVSSFQDALKASESSLCKKCFLSGHNSLEFDFLKEQA